MRRKIGVIILGFLLVGIIGLLAATVPIYPDFQKDIDTYEKAQRIVENHFGVALPDRGSMQLTEDRYTLQLDGRTLFSKPVGFNVYGYLPFMEGAVFYSLHAQPDEQVQDVDLEEHISTGGNATAGMVTAVFRQNGWCYTMTGTYPRSGSEEAKIQIEHDLQDILIGHYRLLFDQLC